LLFIVLPLSKAVLAVLVIYYGISHWNSFFDALLYLPNPKLQPIQIYLRRVLIQASPELMSDFGQSQANKPLSIFQIKYAVAMVVIGPIILIYPFLQRYFVKGIMIGSLKG
jgi:putative aldouronate transport system permease protein